jgi:dihydrofolate synthase/folylpolyglutamate synthase
MSRFDRLFIPLLGDHQLLNAASAVGAVEALSFYDIPIPSKAIEEGLRRVSWPGRLEIVQRRPLVVLDCAKDTEAARALKETLLKEFACERLIIVVSISSDKNLSAMIDQLAEAADQFIITSHTVMGRAADPSKIAKEVERHSKPYEIVGDVKNAVRRALELASDDDLICVTGSVFLVGEARQLWIEPRNLNS